MTTHRNDFKTIARRELLSRELLASIFLMIVLLGLALAVPADYSVAEHADPSLSTIRGPWLIVWLQYLLRHLPPLMAAILLPLATFIIVAALPWIPRGEKRDASRRYHFGLHQAILLMVTLMLACFTFLGL